MFNERFETTALTTEAANASGVFDRIKGSVKWNSDSSGMATLRALVFPRMKEDDELNFGVRVALTSNSDAVGAARYIAENVNVAENTLAIYDVKCDRCNNISEVFDNLKQMVPRYHPGFIASTRINTFLSPQFPAAVFINTSSKRTVIFAENLDMQRWHRLQSVFLISLPWFYNGTKLNDVENKLLQSLSAPTGLEYVKCIEEIARQYDFESVYTQKIIAKFHQRNRQAAIEAKKSESAHLMDEIRDITFTLREKIAYRNQVEIQLAGMRAALESDSETDEVLLDYFKMNKSITLEKLDRDDVIGLIITGQFEYYDSEMAETQLNSVHSPSYLYAVRNGVSKSDMKMLLKAVFVDEILHMNTIAAYRYEYSQRAVSVEGLANYNFGAKGQFAIPNPHIQAYRCMGQYENLVYQALQNGDIITAIEQCAASCKSLNFGDSAVMERFIVMLCNSSNPFIELPDKSLATVKGAIEWLHMQEKRGE